MPAQLSRDKETRNNERGSVNRGNNVRHNEGNNGRNHRGGSSPLFAARLFAIYWRRPNRLDIQGKTVFPIPRNNTTQKNTLGILPSTRRRLTMVPSFSSACPMGGIHASTMCWFRAIRLRRFWWALLRLRQNGTVHEYQTQFEQLASRVQDWPEKALLGCYVARLREEIRVKVKLFRPTTLLHATSL